MKNEKLIMERKFEFSKDYFQEFFNKFFENGKILKNNFKLNNIFSFLNIKKFKIFRIILSIGLIVLNLYLLIFILSFLDKNPFIFIGFIIYLLVPGLILNNILKSLYFNENNNLNIFENFLSKYFIIILLFIPIIYLLLFIFNLIGSFYDWFLKGGFIIIFILVFILFKIYDFFNTKYVFTGQKNNYEKKGSINLILKQNLIKEDKYKIKLQNARNSVLRVGVKGTKEFYTRKGILICGNCTNTGEVLCSNCGYISGKRKKRGRCPNCTNYIDTIKCFNCGLIKRI